MSQTVANVSAAKPKVGGAIYKAPIGTALPTNATAELDPAFVSLGYMSDAGLKRAINLSTNPIKAWGGDTIANPQTDKSEKFTFEAAEVLNPEVQKLVNGDSNVSGTVAEGMTVKINTKELEEHAYVIEEILRGGVLKRTVIASNQFAEGRFICTVLIIVFLNSPLSAAKLVVNLPGNLNILILRSTGIKNGKCICLCHYRDLL